MQHATSIQSCLAMTLVFRPSWEGKQCTPSQRSKVVCWWLFHCIHCVAGLPDALHDDVTGRLATVLAHKFQASILATQPQSHSAIHPNTHHSICMRGGGPFFRLSWASATLSQCMSDMLVWVKVQSLSICKVTEVHFGAWVMSLNNHVQLSIHQSIYVYPPNTQESLSH